MAALQPTCPPFPILDGVRFAAIPGYPGYAASDDGRIWSCKVSAAHGYRHPEWHTLKSFIGIRDYVYATVYTNKKTFNRRVSRLVLLAFRGLPESDDLHACHNNGNKGDNALSNLRWGTAKENEADKRLHGTSPQGERHPRCKYSSEVVAQIRTLRSEGKRAVEISRIIGVPRDFVFQVLAGTARAAG